MSMINYASREINCKIVYYGPGLGGKTTNLEHVGDIIDNSLLELAAKRLAGQREGAVAMCPRPLRGDPFCSSVRPPNAGQGWLSKDLC